jgi:hypothetical protein
MIKKTLVLRHENYKFDIDVAMLLWLCVALQLVPVVWYLLQSADE